MSHPTISAGRWNILKGELKSRWATLTDNDVEQVGGNVDKLIGTIQQRTGEARQSIEDWLRNQGYADVLDSGLSGAGREAGRYARRAADQLREYSWSDITNMLEQNMILTIAGALLMGFALGRLSQPTYDPSYIRRVLDALSR
jgi:uncharacterized protein YjbJ (UPF0337 family)